MNSFKSSLHMKKRQVIIENCDRLSSLNDSILYHIFSFLPTKYVVQTSTLSKRWRKLCFSLPYLYFEEFEETRKEGFMNFVDKFLLHRHKSTKIIKFRLSCEYACDDSHVNSWVNAAVMAGVEELDLYTRQHITSSHNRSLPMCLFKCNSLVALILDFRVSIHFPKFFSFPKMKRMHLRNTILPKNFSHMLSNSPNLETLILEYCRVDTTSSPPSLCTFQDLIAEDHSSGSFSNLNDAHIDIASYNYIHYSETAHFLSKFIRMVYNVENLKLSEGSIKLLGYKSYLLDYFPTFYNLKHLSLELNVSRMNDGIGVMASLLLCFPILRFLRIEFYNILRRGQKLEELPSLCVPASLKWIGIDHFCGNKSQYELVKLILMSAQFLEKLVVQVDVIDPILLRQDLLLLPRLATNCVFEIF